MEVANVACTLYFSSSWDDVMVSALGVRNNVFSWGAVGFWGVQY